ncbi:MAG: GxxExxY protein [Thermoflexales bacterium]|nr:GxxExxY protein [Thermoflexales bacterium]
MSGSNKVDLLYKDEVYALVGAAMQVYTSLGSGFLEAVYQEALEIEFAERRIPFEAQRELHIYYREHCLNKTYMADFIAFGQVVLEIKALDCLTAREEAQLLNYLKATGMQVGVLINFGSADKLEWKRMVLTKHS